MKHIAGDLTNELEKKSKTGEEFEQKIVFGKYSMDAMASSAFGVNAESFTNEKSNFVKYAADIFVEGPQEMAMLFVRAIPGVPQLLSLLKVNTFKPKQTKFFKFLEYSFSCGVVLRT